MTISVGPVNGLTGRLVPSHWETVNQSIPDIPASRWQTAVIWYLSDSSPAKTASTAMFDVELYRPVTRPPESPRLANTILQVGPFDISLKTRHIEIDLGKRISTSDDVPILHDKCIDIRHDHKYLIYTIIIYYYIHGKSVITFRIL